MNRVPQDPLGIKSQAYFDYLERYGLEDDGWNRYCKTIEITNEMIKKASERSERLGQLNDSSFMMGKGNLAGFIGEYMFHSVFPEAEHVDTYGHDFVLSGKKIDVKTKSTSFNGDPLLYNHVGSVADYQEGYNDSDIYFFARVYFQNLRELIPGRIGWLIGMVGKDDFYTRSTAQKAGEKDVFALTFGNDNVGYTVREDCHSLPYREMTLFPEKD